MRKSRNTPNIGYDCWLNSDGLQGNQVGKATLAQVYGRQYYRGSVPPTHYFDLEDPGAIARLQTPMLTLEPLSGLIIIDEIQRQPELFPLLRVLADTKRQDTRFLILGSASLDLIKNSSESLAGRIRYMEIAPLSLSEAGYGMRVNYGFAVDSRLLF